MLMGSLYEVSRLTDRAQIRDYLLTDRNYSAYALGDLDPRHFQHTMWFAAARNGEIEGLALTYTALEPPVLFLMGAPSALSTLLTHGVGSNRVFFTAKPAMESTLARLYRVTESFQMFRMRIIREDFVSQEEFLSPSRLPLPLDSQHIPEIVKLIEESSLADGRDLRDVAFTPSMVEDGTYRGVFRDGQQIAIAGTHLAAPQSRMAAIGNVVVHPSARRAGLGRIV